MSSPGLKDVALIQASVACLKNQILFPVIKNQITFEKDMYNLIDGLPLIDSEKIEDIVSLNYSLLHVCENMMRIYQIYVQHSLNENEVRESWSEAKRLAKRDLYKFQFKPKKDQNVEGLLSYLDGRYLICKSAFFTLLSDPCLYFLLKKFDPTLVIRALFMAIDEWAYELAVEFF